MACLQRLSCTVSIVLCFASFVGTDPAMAQGASESASGVPAQTAETPDIVVSRIMNTLLGELRSDEMLQSGNPKRIRAALDKTAAQHLDMAAITEATLGPTRWKQISSANRRELTEQYFQLLIVQYASHLSRITQNEPVKTKILRSDKTSAVVEVTLKTSDGTTTTGYKLRAADGTWKISDVSVLGVWFVAAFQGQFDHEIERGGIDGLIAKLTSKTQGRAAANPSL